MLPLVCVLLLATSALGRFDEYSLDAQWEEWKSTHRKEYNGLVSVCYYCFRVKIMITLRDINSTKKT